ncbi:MAG: universal stress protein [Chloroflexi bacterium]|nr:universal stress protein [Chloroflexota bacterium]
MSIVIAVDAANIEEGDLAASVVQAAAARLLQPSATAYLLTVVDPGEARGRRLSGEPATYHSETMPADLSGGRVPGSSARGPALQPVVEDRGQAMASLEADVRHELEQLATAHLAGVTYELRVEAGEDVARTIAAVASEVGAIAIAIGTHARRGLGRALLGSVAESLIRTSDVPVLVVREGMRVGSA